MPIPYGENQVSSLFNFFSDLPAEGEDGFWTDLGDLDFNLDFDGMRRLLEKQQGYSRRLRPGYSSMIWRKK